MYENISKTNLDFKNITKDYIDEFIRNCESEKEKGRMIELEILETEKKLFKWNNCDKFLDAKSYWQKHVQCY